MDLKLLFNEENAKCKGCSILKLGLPQHSIMDYEGQKEVDILFLSDTPKMHQGDFVAFRPGEFRVILTELNKLNLPKTIRIGFSSSVKCPNLKADDVSAKDAKICRQHLDDTINQFKPKLVFACGKLASTMIFGKNVEDKKSRGKIVEKAVGDFKFKVMSIIHPWQVVSEPKNAFLFNTDIENGINTEILKIEKKTNFEFVAIDSLEELNKYETKFSTTTQPVSLDIETTGLNFLEDTIHTVALSILNAETLVPELTISMPLDHPENKQGIYYKAGVCKFLIKVLANQTNRKVLQKFGFDLKFLKRYGIEEVHNIWDTKIMQHVFNEDVPKSLADLVLYYYPNEI